MNLHSSVERCFTSRDSIKYGSDRYRKTLYSLHSLYFAAVTILKRTTSKIKRYKLRVKFWCPMSYIFRLYLCLDAALEKNVIFNEI